MPVTREQILSAFNAHMARVDEEERIQEGLNREWAFSDYPIELPEPTLPTEPERPKGFGRRLHYKWIEPTKLPQREQAQIPPESLPWSTVNVKDVRLRWTEKGQPFINPFQPADIDTLASQIKQTSRLPKSANYRDQMRQEIMATQLPKDTILKQWVLSFGQSTEDRRRWDRIASQANVNPLDYLQGAAGIAYIFFLGMAGVQGIRGLPQYAQRLKSLAYKLKQTPFTEEQIQWMRDEQRGIATPIRDMWYRMSRPERTAALKGRGGEVGVELKGAKDILQDILKAFLRGWYKPTPQAAPVPKAPPKVPEYPKAIRGVPKALPGRAIRAAVPLTERPEARPPMVTPTAQTRLQSQIEQTWQYIATRTGKTGKQLTETGVKMYQRQFDKLADKLEAEHGVDAKGIFTSRGGYVNFQGVPEAIERNLTAPEAVPAEEITPSIPEEAGVAEGKPPEPKEPAKIVEPKGEAIPAGEIKRTDLQAQRERWEFQHKVQKTLNNKKGMAEAEARIAEIDKEMAGLGEVAEEKPTAPREAKPAKQVKMEVPPKKAEVKPEEKPLPKIVPEKKPSPPKEKAAKVEAKPKAKPKPKPKTKPEPTTFPQWVARHGGLDYQSIKKDYPDIRQDLPRKGLGIFRSTAKGGRALDDLAKTAQEEGLIPADVTSPADYLIEAVKQGKPIGEAEVMERPIPASEEIPTGELNEGDRVRIGGEPYTVTSVTDKNVTLEDDQKIVKESTFDELEIDRGSFLPKGAKEPLVLTQPEVKPKAKKPKPLEQEELAGMPKRQMPTKKIGAGVGTTMEGTALEGARREAVRAEKQTTLPTERKLPSVVKSREFAFDANSTQNYGRFRLIQPDEFDKEAYTIGGKGADFITRDKKRGTEVPGIRFIVGKINGEEFVQSVRFRRDTFTEEQASEWWQKNAASFIRDVQKGGLRDLPVAEPPRETEQLYGGIPGAEALSEAIIQGLADETHPERAIPVLTNAYNRIHDWVLAFGEQQRLAPQLRERLMKTYHQRAAAFFEALDRVQKGMKDYPLTPEQKRQVTFHAEDKTVDKPPGLEDATDVRIAYRDKLTELSKEAGIIAEGFPDGAIARTQEKIAKLEGKETLVARDNKRLDELKAELDLLERFRGYLTHNPVVRRVLEAKEAKLPEKERRKFIANLARLSYRFRERKGRLTLQEYYDMGLLKDEDLDIDRLLIEMTDSYLSRLALKELTDFAYQKGFVSPFQPDPSWVAMGPFTTGVIAPEYKGHYVHPLLASAYKEMRLAGRGLKPWPARMLSTIKVAQFIKPNILWQYDLLQKLYLGGWSLKSGHFIESFRDVIGHSDLYREYRELGLYQKTIIPSAKVRELHIQMALDSMNPRISKAQKILQKAFGVPFDKKKVGSILKQLLHPVANVTWMGDEIIRTTSARALEDMGYGREKAVKKAARWHGAYAELSRRYREQTGYVTFVSSFRVLMPMEMYKTMKGFVQLAVDTATGKAHPKRDYAKAAKSLFGLIIIPTLAEVYLRSRGFKTDKAGWKWKKTVKIGDEEREVVVTLNNIINMPLKWYHRFMAYDPVKPTWRPIQGLWGFSRWEIHPFHRGLIDITQNRRSFGGGHIWNPNERSELKKLGSILAYAVGHYLRVLASAEEAMFAGDLNEIQEKEAEKFLDEGLNWFEDIIFRKWYSQFGYAYVRNTEKKYGEILLGQLTKEYRRRAIQAAFQYKDFPALKKEHTDKIEKWYEAKKKYIEDKYKTKEKEK